MSRGPACLALCALVLVAAGCTTYYMVRNPTSGATSYTTEVKRMEQTGAVTFEDARSGGVVTMRSSEVREIKSDQYLSGRTARGRDPALCRRSYLGRQGSREVFDSPHPVRSGRSSGFGATGRWN
jgi:hypothetical protein